MHSGQWNGFRLPLYLRPAGHGGLYLFVGAAHAGAVVCLFTAASPMWLKAGLLLVAVVSLAVTLRGINARAGMQVVLNARGDWFLIEATGQTYSLRPVSGQILHADLMLMTFRDEGGRLLPFVFTARTTGRDSLRRLRVRLRVRSD